MSMCASRVCHRSYSLAKLASTCSEDEGDIQGSLAEEEDGGSGNISKGLNPSEGKQKINSCIRYVQTSASCNVNFFFLAKIE